MVNKPVFILLAGGKSERMGVDKGLLKYKQTFWILEQLKRISKSELKDVYIGLGYNYQNYFNAIPWLANAINNGQKFEKLNIKVCINKNPEKGKFSTLQTVLQSIQKEKTVIINLIDVPILNTIELNALIETKNSIVIPKFENKNGHPIKITNVIWNTFLKINTTDKTARLDFLIKNYSENYKTYVNVTDKSIILNLNTKTAWKEFLQTTN